MQQELYLVHVTMGDWYNKENLLNFVVVEITIKSYYNGPNLDGNEQILLP